MPDIVEESSGNGPPGLADALDDCPVNYSSMRSQEPRFEGHMNRQLSQSQTAFLTTVRNREYDTNCAHKSGFAKQVNECPINYSSMRSQEPRFEGHMNGQLSQSQTKFNTLVYNRKYNTNCAHRKEFVDALAEDPINYSSMRSDEPRFEGHMNRQLSRSQTAFLTTVRNREYDTNCAHKSDFAKQLNEASNTCRSQFAGC
jgi:hypothetical protein